MSRNNRLLQFIVSGLCTVLAVVALAISYKENEDQQKQGEKLEAYVRCQAEWTSFLYRANVAGRNANAATQKAMDDLVEAVSTAKSPTESRAALDRYRQARAEQAKALQDNPLPPPPGEVCSLGQKV